MWTKYFEGVMALAEDVVDFAESGKVSFREPFLVRY
jgi:hypothetical protein